MDSAFNRPPVKCVIGTNAVHTNSFCVNRLTIWQYDLVRVRGTKNNQTTQQGGIAGITIVLPQLGTLFGQIWQARAQIKFQQLGTNFFQHWNRWETILYQPSPRQGGPRVCSTAVICRRWCQNGSPHRGIETRGKEICESARVLGFHFQTKEVISELGQRKLSQKPTFALSAFLSFVFGKRPNNLSKLPRFEKTHLLDLYASAWSLKRRR